MTNKHNKHVNRGGGGSAATKANSNRRRQQPTGASLSRIQRVGDHDVSLASASKKHRGVEGGGGGSAATSRSRAQNAWAQIEPYIDEIRELRATGTTMRAIADRYGISYNELYELKRKKTKLKDALNWANTASEEQLVGRVYELADGKATRFEKTKIKDENGNPKGSQEKIIRIEPQLPALLALLKRYHGWTGDQKLNDAIAANALTDAQLREKAFRRHGLPLPNKPGKPQQNTDNKPSNDDDSAGNSAREEGDANE